MAIGDDRKTIQIADLDLQKVNTALAQLSTWVMRLEGRSGGINLRDSVTIQSDKQSLIDFESGTAGKASIAVFGTENATLAFAKGSRKENNGDWVATDTVSVIWALDRAGNGTLYVNTGLVEGQAFTPTVSFVVGSGGSVTPHVLDSATHTVSGKTAGHVLQALTATTFGFAALTGLNVTNTPSGGIAATSVQAAINELDTEKVAKAGDTMSGLLSVMKTGGTGYINLSNLVESTNYGAISFGTTSAQPAAANYALIGNGTNTYLNASTGGTLGLRVANVDYVSITPTGVSVAGDMVIADKLIGASSRQILRSYDTYLRINEGSEHANGIWFGSSDLKVYTGAIRVGSDGNANGNVVITGNGDTTTRISLVGATGYVYAQPIVGKWQQDSNLTGTGYFIWESQYLNSNTSELARVNGHGTSNDSIQLSRAGYYRISAQLMGYFPTAGTTYQAEVYQNSTVVAATFNNNPAGTYVNFAINTIIYAEANDIVAILTDAPNRHGGVHSHITIERLN